MSTKQKHKYTTIPALVLSALAIVVILTCIDAGDTSLLYRMDAPVHDRLFRFRNFVAEQPISRDVSLIGIDDYAVDKLGKFGSGSWVTRKSFVDQMKYAQQIYKPSVLAYDIIFKEIKGKIEKEEGNITKEELLKILVAIRKFGNNDISEIDIDTLNDIAKLTSDQGNANLALAMSLFTFDESNPTTTILAFDCVWPDKSMKVAQRGWSLESILGDDESDLSEDNGTEIPYLRDVSIPREYVYDLPENYHFSKNANLPSRILLDYAKLAYINVLRDEGGVVRRIPLIHGIEYEFADPETNEKIRREFFLPSMAFLACLQYWGIDLTELHANNDFLVNDKPVIEVFWGKYVSVRKPSGRTVRIPIDKHGKFYLDFVGKINDFNSVSFAEVGAFNANPKAKEILQNKISLVGVTSTGASDVGPCPVDDNTPFVHVHMTAVSNILMKTFIRPVGRHGGILTLILLGIALTPAAILLRPLRFSNYVSALAIIYALIAFYFIFTHKFVLPVTGPLLFLIISYFSVVLYYYVVEEREKKKIRGMFSTMVSGEVLQFLEDNPESFSLAGQSAEATIFFSDLAGFTTISESLGPEKLVELLNRYLSPMTEIIMDSQGFVDKYEGDAIMAEWGVPFPNPDHAKLACWAAIDQQKKLSVLTDEFKEEFGVDLVVRMGLNSGTVSAGNMGSDMHFSYTVMGDAVNQAARFEPANKDYGTLIMIGQSTFELAEDYIEARFLDKIVVKGKTIPINVYELIARKGELPDDKRKVVAFYTDGVKLHWERKWDAAIDCFKDALRILPDDGPSQAMLERVEQYRQSPPPESWQGEFVRTVK